MAVKATTAILKDTIMAPKGRMTPAPQPVSKTQPTVKAFPSEMEHVIYTQFVCKYTPKAVLFNANDDNQRWEHRQRRG